MEDRIPPQNVEAEQSVLGAMLISREAIEKACEILRVDDFYRQDDRIVFGAIKDLHERNEAVDLVTVIEELRKRASLMQLAVHRPSLTFPTLFRRRRTWNTMPRLWRKNPCAGS